MKNYLLKSILFLAFIAFTSYTYAQADITLHVIDTSKTLTSVKIKGGFDTDWGVLHECTGTATADGLATDWAVVISMADGTYEWGAIQDNGDEGEVWLLGTIDQGNRSITVASGVPTGDTAIYIPVVDPVDVTVSVDMSFEISSKGGFDVTTDSVGLAGTMNEVDGAWGFTKMTKGDNDSIYSVTFQAGNLVKYKFRKNDGGWEGDPDRKVYVDGKSDPQVVEVDWFNRVSPAPVVSIKCFVIDSTEYQTELLYKGQITGWSDVPMYDDGTNGDEVAGDHKWTVTLDNVAAGASYAWGVIDGDDNWLIVGDDRVVELDIDGNIVGESNVYVIAAWGTVPVTFSVNMNCHINLGVFSADSCLDVNIDGYPPVEMTLADTGVYTATVTRFSVGDELAYTYRIGCAFGGDYEEYSGDASNRTYTVIDGTNDTGVELFQDDVLTAPCDYVSSIEYIDANRIQVYPNPAGYEVRVSSEFMIRSIDLYNITGQRVLSKDVDGFSSYLSVDQLKQGIYMISVNGTDGERAFTKIVKN